jgi:hypothetical protein
VALGVGLSVQAGSAAGEDRRPPGTPAVQSPLMAAVATDRDVYRLRRPVRVSAGAVGARIEFVETTLEFACTSGLG